MLVFLVTPSLFLFINETFFLHRCDLNLIYAFRSLEASRRWGVLSRLWNFCVKWRSNCQRKEWRSPEWSGTGNPSLGANLRRSLCWSLWSGIAGAGPTLPSPWVETSRCSPHPGILTQKRQLTNVKYQCRILVKVVSAPGFSPRKFPMTCTVTKFHM